jgi:hypothetical protein
MDDGWLMTPFAIRLFASILFAGIFLISPILHFGARESPYGQSEEKKEGKCRPSTSDDPSFSEVEGGLMPPFSSSESYDPSDPEDLPQQGGELDFAGYTDLPELFFRQLQPFHLFRQCICFFHQRTAAIMNGMGKLVDICL